MLEAKIVNTGRGPEIAGTRITVYDVISTRSHAPAWERGCAAVGNTQRSPLGVPCSSRCVVAHSDRTPERRRRHSHAGAWERGCTAVGNTQGVALGWQVAGPSGRNPGTASSCLRVCALEGPRHNSPGQRPGKPSRDWSAPPPEANCYRPSKIPDRSKRVDCRPVRTR